MIFWGGWEGLAASFVRIVSFVLCCNQYQDYFSECLLPFGECLLTMTDRGSSVWLWKQAQIIKVYLPSVIMGKVLSLSCTMDERSALTSSQREDKHCNLICFNKIWLLKSLSWYEQIELDSLALFVKDRHDVTIKVKVCKNFILITCQRSIYTLKEQLWTCVETWSWNGLETFTAVLLPGSAEELDQA